MLCPGCMIFHFQVGQVGTLFCSCQLLLKNEEIVTYLLNYSCSMRVFLSLSTKSSWFLILFLVWSSMIYLTFIFFFKLEQLLLASIKLPSTRKLVNVYLLVFQVSSWFDQFFRSISQQQILRFYYTFHFIPLLFNLPPSTTLPFTYFQSPPKNNINAFIELHVQLIINIRQIRKIMTKTFFLTVLSFLAIYLLYIYHTFFPSLAIYYVPRLKNNSSSMGVVLEDLSQAPVIGHFYIEEAIFHSAIQKNWDKVLNLAESAIATPINQNRFTIWYHKALAECLLKKYEKCKQSARIANGLTKASEQFYLQNLFDLVELSEKNKELIYEQTNGEIKFFEDKQTDGLQQEPIDELLISQL